ncbi:MAG TPA: pentapeptide repeat-containing protein [Pyrinomonadaceae bacterium]|nr:pentapeptide repeat-containing protein [Pyrinomonadaceae bacterium]
MSSSPTDESVNDYTFVCESDEWCRESCVGEPYYGEKEGKKYCVLHFPGKEKAFAFDEALKARLKAQRFDFRGVWFPGETRFKGFHFTGEVLFSRAFFSEQANFSDAVFGGDVYFTYAEFNSEVSFNSATFRALAYFRHASFREKADFQLAIFAGETDFTLTTFIADAEFDFTTIIDYIKFSGDEETQTFGEQSWLNLQHARIDRPERVVFHTLKLRPHWFVNVDARKFNFISVEWGWQPIINKEIESLKSRGLSQPHRLLSLACRQLAVNAEENHRYDEASKFRYWSMYARQQETWPGLGSWWKFRSWLSMQWSRVSKLPLLRFFNRNWLYWLYWAASGYGERVLRAFAVLICVWLLFTLLYTQVGFARWEPRLVSESDLAVAKRDEIGAPLSLSRALTYSFGVMTFQKPEPRPATTAAQSLVIIETIFGPLQAALLALAIRRKFMR